MNPQDSTPVNNEDANASPQNAADQQPQLPSTTTPTDNDQVVSGAPSQTTDDDNDSTQGDTQDSEDELSKWAKSQKIDLDNPTPEQTKLLAQRLRDTQNWAHNRSNNNKQFNDVQEQLGDDNEDPLEAELRTIRAQNARRDFWDANQDDRTLEGEMIQAVQDMIKAGNKAGAAYYSTPEGWSDLLAIVKARNSGSIKDESFEAGRKTERENLAKVQQAAGPNAAATSSAPAPKLTDDEAIAKMSQAEYNEWRKSNNPFRP